MMKKIFIISFLLICFSSISWAASLQSGYLPYATPATARQIGLGGAFVGAADDMTAIAHNPGGLPWAKGLLFGFQDLENISGIQAYPTGYGSTWGLGLYKASVKQQVGSNTLSFSGNYLLASFATKISGFDSFNNDAVAKKIGIGLTLKSILHQSLSTGVGNDISSSGTQMDLGMLWKESEWMSFGFVIKNALQGGILGSNNISWSNGSQEAIPMGFEAGLSVKVIGDIYSPIYVENSELFLNIDLSTIPYVDGYPTTLRLGLEWAYLGRSFIRLGARQVPYFDGNWKSDWLVSYGVGARSESWGMDLGLTGGEYSSAHLSVLYFPKEWQFEKTRPYEQVGDVNEAIKATKMSDDDIAVPIKAYTDLFKKDEETIPALPEPKYQDVEEDSAVEAYTPPPPAPVEEEVATFIAPEKTLVIEEAPVTSDYSGDPIKLNWSTDDLVTTNNYIIISGEAASDAEIVINSNKAAIEDGKFSVYVPLSPGKNLIVVEGYYKGYRVIALNRKVLWKAKVVVANEQVSPQEIEYWQKRLNDIEWKLKQVNKKLSSARNASEQNKLNSSKKILLNEQSVAQKRLARLAVSTEDVQQRKDKLETLVTLGVVEISSEKEFNLQESITRAELATWMVKAAQLPLPRISENLFTDVPYDHPQSPYIKVITDMHVMVPYSDGSFGPNDPVSESEAQAIFQKFGLIR